MSRFNEKKTVCPNCKASELRSIATSLNVSNKPIFKEQILKGEFQRFSCKDCQHQYYVDDPFMYLDFNSKLMIAQFPKPWREDWPEHESVVSHNFDLYLSGKYAAPTARKMSEGFTLRTVFGLEALAEKMICLENKLDDTLLAILKFQMMQSIKGLKFHPDFCPVLIGIKPDELVFRTFITQQDAKIEKEIIGLPFPQAFDDILKNKEAHISLFKMYEKGTYINVGKIMFPPSIKS